MKLEVFERDGDYHMVDLEEPEWTQAMNPWYYHDFKDIDVWCEQTFGPQDIWGSEPVTGWKRMRNRYYFVSEDKLNWFVMRWS